MNSCVRGWSRSIDLRLKYEEKRVRDLGIGSEGLTLINMENQIVNKFLSRQDVDGFKSVVLAIDLRLKHGMHRNSADLPTSVSYRSPRKFKIYVWQKEASTNSSSFLPIKAWF